jgi:hypothetical protein
MSTEIRKSSVVVAAKDHVSCDLVGEAVILHLKSGVYYGLNTVGARVWSLIQEPKTVDALLVTLLDEYDVDSGRCEFDLLALLSELKDNDLLEIAG